MANLKVRTTTDDDVSRSDLQAVRILGLSRLHHPTATRHRSWCGHDASRDVSASPRSGPLERGVRSAVASTGRWPVRRESESRLQTPPVPGHPEAGAR